MSPSKTGPNTAGRIVRLTSKNYSFKKIFDSDTWQGTEEELVKRLAGYEVWEIRQALFPEQDNDVAAMMNEHLKIDSHWREMVEFTRNEIRVELDQHLYRRVRIKTDIHEALTQAHNAWRAEYSAKFRAFCAHIVVQRHVLNKELERTLAKAAKPHIEKFSLNGRERWQAVKGYGADRVVCGHAHRYEAPAKACLRKIFLEEA